MKRNADVGFFTNPSALPEDPIPINVGSSIRHSYSRKERHNLSTRTQILIYLALLAIVDAVIPIPVTAMALIMVLFQKPSWFKDWVDQIYRR